MEEMSDRELQRVRGRFVDLLKSFFVESPDAERLSRWRGTFGALKNERINPKFDGAVRDLGDRLNSVSLDALQEEYYSLFVDPVGENRVELTASYHMDGRSYDRTLVAVRGFMDEAGLHKDRKVTPEPEDSLVVLLDSYARLIEEEASRPDEARVLQARLLKEFLMPAAIRIDGSFRNNPKAGFYSVCARFLCGYLELEKGLCG